jgi:2-oxo-4-hydroxy-4-carboxy--5-ureidoimidazoline (OHCU) decarboxylase
MTSLPPISTLPTLPAPSITSILDTLFEPSPPLHALSLPTLQSTTYPSYTALIAAIHTQLSTLASSSSLSDIETLSAILCAHPRLGEKKVDSEQSRKEQAQLNKGGMEEAEELGRLNGVYEEQFPGLRYV